MSSETEGPQSPESASAAAGSDPFVDRRWSASRSGRRNTDWGSWGARKLTLPGDEAPLAIPKILVVDDAASARAARRDALSVLQVEIIEAASGGEAIRTAREHDFALILLDSDMPDMGGFEVVSLLRTEKRTEATPVIFTMPTADGERMGYRVGAVDCIVDGHLDAEALRQKVRAFLALHAQHAALQAAHERVEAEKRALETRNREIGEQLEMFRRQSTHDPLTGLPNRLLFEDRLDGGIRRSTRNKQPLALAFINLDGFRQINEELGYNAGDELIATIGRRLLQSVRASDTVARLSADEFAVLLEGLHSVSSAEYVGHKLHTTIAQPSTVLADPHGTPTQVVPKASIGIAVYPDLAQTREEFLAAADTALHDARRAGGGAKVAQLAPKGLSVVATAPKAAG